MTDTGHHTLVGKSIFSLLMRGPLSQFIHTHIHTPLHSLKTCSVFNSEIAHGRF